MFTDVQPLPKTLSDAYQVITAQNERIVKLERLTEQLQEALQLLKHNQFGRSSEKDLHDPQGSLFNEAELLSLAEDSEPHADTHTSPATDVTVAAHTRRGHRVPLPESLPRVRIEHQLPAADLVTADGKVFEKFGERIVEQLEVIPAQVYVTQHVRFKYAVPGYEEYGVKVAPILNQPIPKSIASASLLSHIAQSKYDYHLPLYRQERLWKDNGVDINRTSMARWLVDLGERVSPLTELILQRIKRHPTINVDETRVTVINDDHKKRNKASHTGMMWFYGNAQGVFYEYTHSRAGKHALNRLWDYQGFVQSDGFSGYDQLFDPNHPENPQTQYPKVKVGCMAHARRKFMDVIKASGNTRKPYAQEATFFIEQFKKLYQIEADIKAQGYHTDNPDHESKIRTIREQNSQPILNAIDERFKSIESKVMPKSLLGKALGYLNNHWGALNTYITNGQVEIDNNRAERGIKPFVIGRKNWMFSSTTEGAKASANLLTLIENAKHQNLNVFEYLKYVFEHMNAAIKHQKQQQNKQTTKAYRTEVEEITLEKLLPQYVRDNDLLNNTQQAKAA